MKILTISLTLLLIHQSYQNEPQDLCRDAAANGFVFADDASSCNRYLWCAPDGRTAVLDCRNNNPNFPYFRNDFCVSTNAHCNPMVNLCPPSGQPDIMIAVAGDPTCTEFRPCRLPGFPPLRCPTGLQFERNRGVCISADNVDCPYDSDPDICEGQLDGLNPIPDDCYGFVFCFGGVEQQRNRCEEGYHFDPDAAVRNCVLGPCPDPPPGP